MKAFARNSFVGVLAAVLTACGAGSQEPESNLEVEQFQTSSAALEIDASRRAVSYDWGHRDNLIHGIAGDTDVVFVTEPLVGRVVVLDRYTGQEIAYLPAPATEGFLLPFTARVPHKGRLVLLDAGGFPNPFIPAIPRVYDYDYTYDRRTKTFSAQLVRTVRFDGLPVIYAEDIEVLDDGTYVMSESVIGGIWVIHPDGTIAPGVVPEGPEPLPEIGPCELPIIQIGGIPFAPGFAPGIGSLAARNGQLYFGNSCKGGIHRIPIASLTDSTRSPSQRAADIVTVSERAPGDYETLKGLSFDPSRPNSNWVYVGDPFHLRLLRVNVDTGARQVVSDDATLFNFSVSTAFLPPVLGVSPLMVTSDQEHRLATLNPGIPVDEFQLPFIITKVYVLQ